MSEDFLTRVRPILTEAGLATLRSKRVAFAGLGGVGGGSFLALVRSGVTRFRLAEDGVFDPPDMNRQAAAFGHTMDRRKLDVYVELARSINPDVELELFPEGVATDNFERFLTGADLYVGVIDAEKGGAVKAMTPGLIQKLRVPMFTCGAVGFGCVLVAHEPGGMMPEEFWRLAQEKSSDGGFLPSLLGDLFDRPVLERIAGGLASGKMPTTAIGCLAANALLAGEVLVCLLRGTGVVDREPVYAPRFAVLDFLSQKFEVGDVSQES